VRILVTGGLGFIGVNLIAALRRRPGAEIRVLDNGRAGNYQLPFGDPRIQIRLGDILNPTVVEEAMAGADVVVHLAAETGIVESVRVPRKSLQVNVEGTLNLLEAARAQGIKRFVFASSNAAVGAHEPPLDESKVPAPVSPYGAGKAAGEALVAAYARAYRLGTVSLRFSNVYGPYSQHKGSVIATFFQSALGEGSLTIHGNGSQTRDFLFVDDLNEAICLAMERAEPGSVFQIASGVETPISVVADKIRRLVEADLGIRILVRHSEARIGDVSRNFSSIAQARARLGFAPRIPLDEGLRRTWQWFKRVGLAQAPRMGGVSYGAE